MASTDFKPQLHVTAITRMQTCGHWYYLSNIKGIHYPLAAKLAVGIAAHHGASQNLRHKAIKGELLPREQVAEESLDALKKEADKGDGLSDDDKTPITKKRMDELRDETVRFAAVHYEQVAPKAKPAIIDQEIGGEMRQVTSVEFAYVLAMKNWPFDLAGTIDLLDGKPKKFTIRDNKTARKMPSGNPAINSSQLTAYSMAVHHVLGQPYPIKSSLDHLVIGRKTKPDELARRETQRNADQEKVFLRIFQAACRSLEAGVFMPADPGHFAAPCSYCPHRWGTCVYYTDPSLIGTKR